MFIYCFKVCLNLLILISCANSWFGKLSQYLMIVTKKEYFRELTFADFVWILYGWFSVFAFKILEVVIEVQAI